MRDPGLQAERTALAWHRTALTLFVNAALTLRAGISDHEPLATALGAGLLLSTALAVLFGALRGRRLARGDVRAVSPLALAGMAMVTCLASLAGLASFASLPP